MGTGIPSVPVNARCAPRNCNRPSTIQWPKDTLFMPISEKARSTLMVVAARRRGIYLEKELMIAMVRGLVQIVAVGSILLLVLHAPDWTSVLLLMSMIVAAGATSARRAKGMPEAFRVSTYSIACGAGSVIALMTWLGVIDTPITTLVPVGSMLIANAMNTNSLALNRFRSEVLAHVGEIETALALGADGKSSVAPYVQTSFEASLIPAIDSLRSLSCSGECDRPEKK